MKEPDLDSLLREWRIGQPSEGLDRRMIAAYRSAVYSEPADSAPFWRRFWTTQVSIPAPALVATAFAVLAVLGLLLWFRPSTAPVPSPQNPGAVMTRLNVNGFQSLPNGKARVVPATEVQR